PAAPMVQRPDAPRRLARGRPVPIRCTNATRATKHFALSAISLHGCADSLHAAVPRPPRTESAPRATNGPARASGPASSRHLATNAPPRGARGTGARRVEGGARRPPPLPERRGVSPPVPHLPFLSPGGAADNGGGARPLAPAGAV